MIVIKKLHKQPGYTIDDGWDLRVWGKELPTGVEEAMQLHRVNYLIHVGVPGGIEARGHVNSSQVKAWNDTIRNIMHNELIRLPLARKYGTYLITWEDNSTSHCSTIMNAAMSSAGMKYNYRW